MHVITKLLPKPSTYSLVIHDMPMECTYKICIWSRLYMYMYTKYMYQPELLIFNINLVVTFNVVMLAISGTTCIFACNHATFFTPAPSQEFLASECLVSFSPSVYFYVTWIYRGNSLCVYNDGLRTAPACPVVKGHSCHSL